MQALPSWQHSKKVSHAVLRYARNWHKKHATFKGVVDKTYNDLIELARYIARNNIHLAANKYKQLDLAATVDMPSQVIRYLHRWKQSADNVRKRKGLAVGKLQEIQAQLEERGEIALAAAVMSVANQYPWLRSPYHVGYIPDTKLGSRAKFKLKGSYKTKADAQAGKLRFEEKAKAFGMTYQVWTKDQVLKQWQECEEKSKSKRLASVKKTIETRKASGQPIAFILCPKCGSKSKKLSSEMGGLQTRICQNGHRFGWDTFGGGGRYTQTYEQFRG